MRPKGGYRGGYKIRPIDLEETYDEIDFVQPKKIVGKLISVDVLDKIRDEIEKLKETEYLCFDNYDIDIYITGLNDAIGIIDKYKTESEEKIFYE